MPSKSDHYLQYKGVKSLKNSHPEVKKLKREGVYYSAHGNKVWRSSFVLMDYFTSYPLGKGQRVMDAGCGWGLSGIFLAKHFGARVTGVDIDPQVEPFLKLQARINKVDVDFKKQRFEKITRKDLSHFDAVVGADICFWDELTPVLFKLIRRARKAGVERVVIADPGRPPFWELADLCAEAFDSEVITRTIHRPIKTTKHLLVVGDAELHDR
ncbi:MAG: class I SAM-dependent methyltransferase [bacterium]